MAPRRARRRCHSRRSVRRPHRSISRALARRVATRRRAVPAVGLSTSPRCLMMSCVMIAAVPMRHRHASMFMYPAIAAVIFISMQRWTFAIPTRIGLIVAIWMPLLPGLPNFEQQGVLRDLPISVLVKLVVRLLCLSTIVKRRRRGELLRAGPRWSQRSAGSSAWAGHGRRVLGWLACCRRGPCPREML
jgi:hypothetical protein